MFTVVVVGKSATFFGNGKTEYDAVKNLMSTRINFAAKNATSLEELHDFFKRKQFKWYVQCKLIAPEYTTVRKDRLTISTFPISVKKTVEYHSIR
jgi:hypothetical protein